MENMIKTHALFQLLSDVRFLTDIFIYVKHGRVLWPGRVNAPTMGQLSNFRALKIRNSAHRCDKDLKPTPFNQN